MAARKQRITFGLMNLACRRESAVQAEVTLRSLCVGQEGKDSHAPLALRQDPSWCPTCGDVDRDTLVKGHGSGDSWTVLDDDAVDALGKAKVEFSEHASLKLVLHPAGEFLAVTMPGKSVYYITPEEADRDHYALLVRLIGAHPELAFAGLLSLSTGGTAKLWVLRVRDGALVMEERVREQSLKPAPAVEGEVNDALYAMVEDTLSHFVTDYDAEAYEDKYASALQAALDKGQTVTTDSATPVAKTTDSDLMKALAALGGN